jgi:hypothetical protein
MLEILRVLVSHLLMIINLNLLLLLKKDYSLATLFNSLRMSLLLIVTKMKFMNKVRLSII